MGMFRGGNSNRSRLKRRVKLERRTRRNRSRKGVALKLASRIIALCCIAVSAFLLSTDLGDIDVASSTTSTFVDFVSKPQESLRRQKFRQQKRHLKFDEAGLQPLPGTARSHTLPNAIPLRRMIPWQLAEDKDYHLSRRTNSTTNSITGTKGQRRPFYRDGGLFNWEHNYQQDNRALYIYNPSVLPLYNNLNPEDPDLLSKQDLDALTGGDAAVKYVVVFRANTGANCFGPDYTQLMATGEQLSYLAVALLDQQLDIIPGSDVLIDLNAGPIYGKYFQQFQEDCRIFLIRRTIYLWCNERLLRVKIQRNITSHGTSTTRSETGKSETTKTFTGKDRKCPYVYQPIYGDGLIITLLTKKKVIGGKNLNIFRSLAQPTQTGISTGPYNYYVQAFPLPHIFQRLVIPSPENMTLVNAEEEQKSNATLPPPSFLGPDTIHTITTCKENEEKGTWITNCTKPDVRPFFGDKDHGTTCCIPMSLEGKGNVLVGVSHTKTSPILNPWWRRDIYSQYNNMTFGKRYLSRFLAYSPEPPFDVVARSGWFCMGFAEENESGNSLAGRNKQYRVDLFGHVYNCPSIHFISGLSEFVGDPSKAIISYGINDCHSRMIVVEKKEIARRLLGDKL